jgi:hypothetical protein
MVGKHLGKHKVLINKLKENIKIVLKETGSEGGTK